MLHQDCQHPRVHFWRLPVRHITAALSVVLFCCGLFVLAQAQEGRPVGPNPSAVGQAVTGQIPGTTTNDGAAAGNVGEFIVSGASSNANIGASGTITITIASPAVVSWSGNPYYLSSATNHGCAAIVVFSTTGALPTGITAGQNYYVTCDGALTANQFHFSTSVDNAVAGTPVNTSGTQSGTQSGTNVFAPTSTIAFDAGGLALTPGDWDLSGAGRFIIAASTSVTRLTTSTNSATNFTGSNYSVGDFRTAANVLGGNVNEAMSTARISIASPVTVYCSMQAGFTVAALSAGMICEARRMR